MKNDKFKGHIEKYLTDYERDAQGQLIDRTSSIATIVAKIVHKSNEVGTTEAKRLDTAALLHAAGDALTSSSRRMDEINEALETLKDRFLAIHQEQLKRTFDLSSESDSEMSLSLWIWI